MSPTPFAPHEPAAPAEDLTAPPAAPRSDGGLDVAVIPYVLFHIVALVGVFLVPFSWAMVGWAVGMYYLRMFGITAGYHRYFSHRGYKTSRAVQFLLALLGTFSVQKGVLWWAAHHRDHHKYSDTELDIHSPTRRGFYWAHHGWILSHAYDATKYDRIKDFAKYPELRWLNEHWLAVQVAFGVGMYLLGGWDVLVWGFFVSTVVLWHGTFTINSLSHVYGTQRYVTGDTSRNNFWLALLTMGEGWHNNHHYYQSTARNGFFWWEIDLSWMVLKAMSWVGLVWDLREPPAWVLANTAPPQRGAHDQPDELSKAA